MIRKTRIYSVGLLLGCVLASLSGCASLGYYSQSVVGHGKLMLARKPVDKVIASAEQPLKSQLELSQRLRVFAVQELGLPDSKSYSSYVALKREYPVWNVVAAPEYSLVAKKWCYPVIGCASYRGYFSLSAAQRYAQKLEKQGFETVVGGASAYSTLGWFSDPLLPSMMRYGDADLAETLFHELAHQQLYINGDSDFNEAFATVVGETGAQRWLSAQRPQELNAYSQKLKARQQFYALVETAKLALTRVYESLLTDSDKERAKHATFAKLKQDYQALKNQEWNGQPLFDRWFDTEINNARLVAFTTYRDQAPKLTELLRQCDDDLERFYWAFAKPIKVDGRVQIPSACNKPKTNR